MLRFGPVVFDVNTKLFLGAVFFITGIAKIVNVGLQRGRKIPLFRKHRLCVVQFLLYRFKLGL